MILADHGIEFAPHRPHKHRIRGQRPDNIAARAPGLLDRRLNQPLFLIAERARFSGVGIESGDGQAWLGQTVKTAQMRRGDRDGFLNPFTRQGARNLGQRHMRGHQNHPQRLFVPSPFDRLRAAPQKRGGRPVQHHPHLGRIRQRGQEFGMAGIGMAARLPHGFADRCGDQSVQGPVQGEARAAFDIAKRGIPSGASGTAGDAFGRSEPGERENGYLPRVGGQGIARLPLIRAKGKRQAGRRLL